MRNQFKIKDIYHPDKKATFIDKIKNKVRFKSKIKINILCSKHGVWKGIVRLINHLNSK